jgi:hypothetical protein
MNLIKRNHKDSVHMFGIQELSDLIEQDLGLEHDVVEVDVTIISRITSNIEIRIMLDGGVEMYFVDYADFPQHSVYEIMDWFIDNELEWSSTRLWFDDDDYPYLVTPSHAERLAGAIEICRLLLDENFHDEWNFTVSTELKGGNEYSHMPLHEYLHPAYIRGI